MLYVPEKRDSGYWLDFYGDGILEKMESGYEALVFGSHTEAFQLEQAMKLYFGKIDTLKGINVACISTHQFPFKWMGGNSAVKKMKVLCEEKGAIVLGTAVVDWSPASMRDDKIAAVVNSIASLFK